MSSSDVRPRPGGVGQLAGRPTSRIGYGAMQLEHVDRTAATVVLRRAVELGIDHVDTAAFYGAGTANAHLRAALTPYRDLLLVTKVGAARDGDQLVLAQRPDQLRAQVEENLTQLGVDRLDVVNLRRADTRPGLLAEGDQVVDLDDQLAELLALRDAGKIGALGLSNVSADQLRRALPAGVACVQNAYNLLDRGAEEQLDLCREHGIAWVPFFPLGSAFPGVPKVTDRPEVRAAAARVGATPAQVGLAWLLARAPEVLLIPGTATVTHLEENAAAGDVALDPATLAELDALAG